MRAKSIGLPVVLGIPQRRLTGPRIFVYDNNSAIDTCPRQAVFSAGATVAASRRQGQGQCPCAQNCSADIDARSSISWLDGETAPMIPTACADKESRPSLGRPRRTWSWGPAAMFTQYRNRRAANGHAFRKTASSIRWVQGDLSATGLPTSFSATRAFTRRFAKSFFSGSVPGFEIETKCPCTPVDAAPAGNRRSKFSYWPRNGRLRKQALQISRTDFRPTAHDGHADEGNAPPFPVSSPMLHALLGSPRSSLMAPVNSATISPPALSTASRHGNCSP